MHYAGGNGSHGYALGLRELLYMFKDLGLARGASWGAAQQQNGDDAAVDSGGVASAEPFERAPTLSAVARTAVAAMSFVGVPGADRLALAEFVQARGSITTTPSSHQRDNATHAIPCTRRVRAGVRRITMTPSPHRRDTRIVPLRTYIPSHRQVLYFVIEAHTHDGLQPPLARAERFMVGEVRMKPNDGARVQRTIVVRPSS